MKFLKNIFQSKKVQSKKVEFHILKAIKSNIIEYKSMYDFRISDQFKAWVKTNDINLKSYLAGSPPHFIFIFKFHSVEDKILFELTWM